MIAVAPSATRSVSLEAECDFPSCTRMAEGLPASHNERSEP